LIPRRPFSIGGHLEPSFRDIHNNNNNNNNNNNKRICTAQVCRMTSEALGECDAMVDITLIRYDLQVKIIHFGTNR